MRVYKIFVGLFSKLMLMACSSPKSKSIKVMTWNIWHGGLHGSKADGFKKDTINTINVYKVIHQEAPDELLMEETYCCGIEITEQTGYPHPVRASSNLTLQVNIPSWIP